MLSTNNKPKTQTTQINSAVPQVTICPYCGEIQDRVGKNHTCFYCSESLPKKA